MIRKSVCEKCKLYQGCKTPFMDGYGSDTPDVLIIGEAPGANEDEQGRPFIGRSGELLQEMLDLMELTPDQYRLTNTVRCRPPENKTPTTRQTQYCSEFLLEEIEQVQPRIILLLGNSPLKAVLGVSGITNYNGQVIDRDDVTYIPAYHPAYILRNGMNEELLADWIGAFEHIPLILDGKSYKSGDHYFEYVYPTTIDELEAMADEIISHADVTAYDVENSSKDFLDPDNVILSAGFAIDGKAWAFPVDHSESWWTTEELPVVEDIMDEVLNHPKVKIITHTKYDVKATRALLGIDFRQWGDTIHESRLLNAHHIEHGLKRLAGLHANMFDYDKELEDYKAEHPKADYKYGGSYAAIPLQKLLPYNAKDVAATILIHKAMYPQLTDKQRRFYEQLIIPADYMLGRMEDNGFKLDFVLVEKYQRVYEYVKRNFYAALLEDPDVQQFIASEREQNPKFKFNPNSTQQLAKILYDIKKLPIYGHSDSGNPSCKRDYLLEMRYDFMTQADEFADEIRFLNTYLDWKLVSTILSKSFKPILDPTSDWGSRDGRSRSDYILGGAKTGRIASRNPNLQNIPSVESEPGTILQYRPVKNAFTHTWDGGCLLMADYSGMELRVIASVAHIQGMIDVFARGGDVHRYVSSLIYKKPEEEITKFERYRGKWCNWSLLYRGNWWTLYRLYRINGLTEDEAKDITELYFKAFPELPTYHDRTIKFLMKYGYVESPFGRRLQLPEIKDDREGIRNKAMRTAVNMPIQGTAADTLMAATVVIFHKMQEAGMKSMLVNTVHDSLVTDIYPGELEAVKALQKEVMENMPVYAKVFIPGVDFSWLKVPLKADFDVGSHYGMYGQPVRWKCEHCGSADLTLSNEKIASTSNPPHILYFCCNECGRETFKSYDASDTAQKMAYNALFPMEIPASKAVSRQPRLSL